MMDHPPVKITSKMLSVVSEISLQLGRLQEICEKKDDSAFAQEQYTQNYPGDTCNRRQYAIAGASHSRY